MQDRYAGDIGDFGKIGLLRTLQAQGLSVGMNWYRVEPMDIEKKDDGSFKQEDGKYLIPIKLWTCDETLKQDHDPNRPGDIWEFKKNIDGMQFYVKVKIVQENGEDILKCIGFHEDDFA